MYKIARRRDLIYIDRCGSLCDTPQPHWFRLSIIAAAAAAAVEHSHTEYLSVVADDYDMPSIYTPLVSTFKVLLYMYTLATC